jgi:uncharacterized damage-inducible protein DinB
MGLDAIREKLRLAQTGFCRVADRIGAEEWAEQPGREAWSAAELVAHLVVVERGVIGKADSVIRKTPLAIPFSQRMHLPIWLVEARVIRRKSPLPQDESLLAEKETMLGTLRGARERTLAFLDETEKRDLSVYRWRHPFLGMLTTYDWMQMIAAHQNRHRKQMQEIIEKLSRK